MAERSTLKPVSSSAVPSLVPQGEQAGKPAMPLGRPFTLIGSRNRAHLHLLSSSISRNHAAIISTDTGLYLRDLASRTGVLVNGRKVKEADLHDGEIVQIGSFRFRYTDPSGTTRLGVTPKPTAAMLEVDGTTLTPIDTRTILIGRRPTCDIPLPEASVSNTHAMVFEVNGQRFIRDLGSRTGTLVNGKPIHHQELEFGDEIRIGDTQFRYVSAVAPAEEASELQPSELAHEEDEEPIGLAFDDEQPVHASGVEAIPEADVNDLLPDHEVAAAEEPEHDLIPLEREADESLQRAEVPPAVPEEAAAEEPDIDFEIAGSQLDLQKKLAETSRLAAHPEEPPVHAVTASEELLQPVQDLGLDFLDEAEHRGAEPEAIASEHAAEAPPAEPGETPETTADQHAGSPLDPLAVEPEPVEIPVAPDELTHEFTAPMETAPAVEHDSTSAEFPTAIEPDAELEAEPQPSDQILTADESAVAESQPAVSDEALESAPHATPGHATEDQLVGPPAQAEPALSQIESEESQPASEAVESPETATHVKESQSDWPMIEPEETAPSEAEAQLTSPPEAEAVSPAAEPIALEDIDLSTVDFHEAPPADESAPIDLDEPPQTANEPLPILDLLPEAPPAPPAQESPPAIEAEAAVEAAIEAEVEPPPAGGKRRKKARGRKKKAEITDAPQITEPTIAESAPAPVADESSIPEPAPAETSATELPSESVTPLPAQTIATGDVELPEIEVSSSTESAEVMPPTDPTPDSAQELGEVIDEIAPAPTEPAPEIATADPLSDTAFDRIVEEFAGSESQPLVEQPAADAQASVPDEGIALVEPEPVSESTAPMLDEPVDFSLEAPSEHAITSDVSLDDVIELDSSALIDEPEPSAAVNGPAESLDFEEGPLPSGQAEAPASSEAPQLDEPAPPAVEAPATPVAEAPPAKPFAPAVPINPFFGMERDMGSFLGGIPLALPRTPFAQSAPVASPPETPHPEPVAPLEPQETVPPHHEEPALELPPLPQEEDEPADLTETSPEPSTFVAPEVTEPQVTSHAAPPDAREVSPLDELPDLEDLPTEEKLDFSAEPDTLPPLDTLLADDGEPLELFDTAPQKLDELPDAMEAIGDVDDALAEEKVAAPPAPATPPPAPAAAPTPSPVSDAPAKPSTSPFAAGAAAPVAPPKPKIKPPPPPRTSPLRSFAGNPFEIAPDEIPLSGAGVPPFSGAQPPNRGKVTSFEGLAMPPVREADVFSNSAFSGIDDAFFGQPPSEVPDIPAPGQRGQAGKSQQSPAAAGLNPAPPAAIPGTPGARKPRDRKRDAIPPNRQALPPRGAQAPPARPLAQPAPPPPPGTPKRVPWWKKVRTLLPLMIVCLAGAWVGIIFGFPPKHRVEGLLRFDGMENLDMQQQKLRVDSVRQLIRQPDLRTVAAENAKNSGAPGGFLDDPASLSELSETDTHKPDYSEFLAGRQALLLVHSTTQADLDRVRMKAVLAALYARDGAQHDTASSAKRDLETARAKVASLENDRDLANSKLTQLQAQIRIAGATPTPEMLQGPALWAASLEQRDKQLWDAWQKAITERAQRQAALDKAQAPAPAATSTDVDSDPEVRQLVASVESLTTKLKAARTGANGAAQEPSAVLASALARVDDLLSSIPDTNDTAVNAYLANVRGTRDEVRQILSRTQSDTQTAEQLRHQLLESTSSGQVTDPALRELLQSHDAYAHRYEVATASGLAEEATKARGVLEDIDRKIDARRKAIGTSASAESQPERDSLQQVEHDRKLDGQRIRDRLSQLDASAPREETIPADARAQIVPLIKAVSIAAAAADRFASPDANPAPANDVSKLEAQLASAQSQLQQKRKELADAAARQLSNQDRQARDAAVAAANRALADAGAAADRAASDYASNRKLLSLVRELADQVGRIASIDQSLKLARGDLEAHQKAANVTAALVAPDDSSVSVTYEKDKRLMALGGASLLIVGVFGILMWMASSQPRAEQVPFANAVAVAHDVPGHNPEDFAPSEMFEPDEREPIIA